MNKCLELASNCQVILVVYFLLITLAAVLSAISAELYLESALIFLFSFYTVSLLFLLIGCVSPHLRDAAAYLTVQGSSSILVLMLFIKLVCWRVGQWLRLPWFACLTEGFMIVVLLAETLVNNIRISPHSRSGVASRLGDIVQVGLCLGLGYWVINAIALFYLVVVPHSDPRFAIDLIDVVDFLSLLPIETAGTVAISVGRASLIQRLDIRLHPQFSLRKLTYPICVNTLHSLSVYIAKMDERSALVGVVLNVVNSFIALSFFAYEVKTIHWEEDQGLAKVVFSYYLFGSELRLCKLVYRLLPVATVKQKRTFLTRLG